MMQSLGKGLFVFPTPKIVQIHDPKLGLLRQFLLGLIFIFLVVFHIAYRGSHLSYSPVSGVVRIQLRDPSEDSCDPFHGNCSMGFAAMSKLPYCKQNNFKGVYQKMCEYWDSVELRQMTDEGMLIPTRVMTFMQREKCHPSTLNQWSCNGTLYDFIGQNGEPQTDEHPSPIRDVFVADVERFDILLDHSAHSQSTEYTGDGTKAYDFEMLGTWQECGPEHDKERPNEANCSESPILCVHNECPPGATKPPLDPDSPALVAAPVQTPTYRRKDSYETLEAASEPDLVSEFEVADYWVQRNHVTATQKGDMFKLSKLVRAAGIGMDTNTTHGSGETYRNDGVALIIRIEYTNVLPWIGLQVNPWNPTGPKMFYKYHILTHATGDVKFRKVDYFMDAQSSQVTREVEEFRGVRIVVEQTGSIKVWDTMQLMFLVTTTLALLAISNCILDTVALQCMSRSDHYRRLKYETERPMSP